MMLIVFGWGLSHFVGGTPKVIRKEVKDMAERGFVALAFDPSYNGYSGGEPRHISSPDVFVEDFSAAGFVHHGRARSLTIL